MLSRVKIDTDIDVGVRNTENPENRQLNTAKIRLGSVSVSQYTVIFIPYLSTQKCDRIAYKCASRFSRSAN